MVTKAMKPGDLVPVCAVCREPVGAGMSVVVYDAEDLRARCATLGLRMSHDDGTDDAPMFTCYVCGIRLNAVRSGCM